MSLISKGLYLSEGTSTSEVFTDDYQRPRDWLQMPELTDTDEKIVMLVAVYDHSSNFVAFKCTGDYTVDWGDGSAPENVASGVQAERILDYADFVGTECSRGYRQAIVTITPQVAGGLLTAELAQKHSAAASSYYSTALDISASASNITKLTMIDSSYQTSLEIFTLKRNSITNMSYMFYNCYSLQSVPLFDTSTVTNMYFMFYNCYSLQSVPLFDTAAVTNMQKMFYNCYSLQSVPLFDTAAVTNMYLMFYSCHSLQSVPLFDTSTVTNMSYMFYSCHSLQSVPLFDTSTVTNMYFMFYNCYSLSRSKIINTSVDISYEDCKLADQELNEIFTNLATVSGKTITITGNWGAATCDTSIATNKGWAVIS